MKNVLKPLAKSVLIPLELTATASSTHAAIQKKKKRKGGGGGVEGASGMTTLIISNE